MIREKDILFESESLKFWVTTAKAAGLKYSGYAVWENVGTHAKLVSRIGFSGDTGFRKACDEVRRRELINNTNERTK